MVDIFSDQFSLTTLLATKNLSNWTVTSDLSGRRKEWIVKLSSVRESFTLAKKKRIALKRILRGIFLSVSECSFFSSSRKGKRHRLLNVLHHSTVNHIPVNVTDAKYPPPGDRLMPLAPMISAKDMYRKKVYNLTYQQEKW